MKQPHRMLQSLLAGMVVVGSLAVPTLAEPPRTSAKKPVKKASGREAADSPSASRASSSSKASARSGNSGEKRLEPISKDRAEAAVRFARKHHPELAKLLEGLRKSNDRHYQAGLRALTRDAERLAKMGERQDERYPVSLELWKLESRIRLEIARLSMSPDEDFEPRLRPLMEKRQTARVQLVKMERQRTAERLAKYDDELKTLQSRSDGLVGSEIERLKKMMAARARAKNSRPQTSKDTAATPPKRKPSKPKTSGPANLPTTSAD